MSATDPRRLARLLALRLAARRKAELALASAAAAAGAASEGEARVLNLLCATAASPGMTAGHELSARATLAALLEPALQHARARASAGQAGLAAARTAAAAARGASDAIEVRVEEARRAVQQAREGRRQLDTPLRRKPLP